MREHGDYLVIRGECFLGYLQGSRADGHGVVRLPGTM
jgi:hypothetical protein